MGSPRADPSPGMARTWFEGWRTDPRRVSESEEQTLCPVGITDGAPATPYRLGSSGPVGITSGPDPTQTPHPLSGV